MTARFKFIARFLITGVSYVFPWRVVSRLCFLRDLILAETISRRLGSCGAGFFVRYPVDLHGLECIRIGNGFRAGRLLRIEAIMRYNQQSFTPIISFGHAVCMNNNVHLGCINSIKIGDRVLIGSNVLITDHMHGDTDPISILVPPNERPLVTRGPVSIGDDVWIGDNVVIMPNVIIGVGAVIGAGSVVTKNIPPGVVAVGAPARIIKR